MHCGRQSFLAFINERIALTSECICLVNECVAIVNEFLALINERIALTGDCIALNPGDAVVELVIMTASIRATIVTESPRRSMFSRDDYPV